MPNQLTNTGLEVKSVDEVFGFLAAGFQTIYGGDINIDPSTPDGQALNILAQSVADYLELLNAVYNSFSPVTAFGIALDERVALNGVTRKQGTFTFTDIVVVTDRALTLPGLDAAINDPAGTGFTIADNAGNQFILAATHVIGGPGTNTFSFRAKNIGAVETIPNTITNQVTITLGVTSVNNPNIATAIGENEESDVELKIRHGKSFNLAAVGPADSIQGAILNINGVTDALVAENTTGALANGVPAHGIWTIVENGALADIGKAIYAKKAPGCAMKGSVSFLITRPNGTTFTAVFDRPISQNLFVRFSILPRNPGVTFDNTLIKQELAAALQFKLNQSPNIGDVVIAMLTIAPLGILTSVQVSADGANWFDIVTPTDFQHKFVADQSRITIL
jgi:uncharacterized phage protein gp47/JayE